MGYLLISKKGTMPKVLLFIGIMLVVLCVVMYAVGATESRLGDNDTDEFINQLLPVLSALCGLFMILLAVNQGKTFIHVYDNHIEGSGMDPKALTGVKSFYIDRSQNFSLQKEGKKITMTYNGASFYVMLTEQDAQEVYNCVYSGYRPPYGGQQSYGGQQTYGGQQNYGGQRNYGGQQSYGGQQTYGGQQNHGSQQTNMKIVVSCPECNTKSRVTAGQTVATCPMCGRKFNVMK